MTPQTTCLSPYRHSRGSPNRLRPPAIGTRDNLQAMPQSGCKTLTTSLSLYLLLCWMCVGGRPYLLNQFICRRICLPEDAVVLERHWTTGRRRSPPCPCLRFQITRLRSIADSLFSLQMIRFSIHDCGSARRIRSHAQKFSGALFDGCMRAQNTRANTCIYPIPGT